MEKIDLHMHSNFSDDADLPVSELIERCKAHNVKTLAITDHNSADSVTEAMRYADKTLSVISGIEIDCTFAGKNYHLLGYGFTLSDDFIDVHRNFNRLQEAVIPQQMDKLRALGFYLDEALLAKFAGGRLPQGEQMGETILADERNDNHELLFPYRRGGSRSDMPLINFYWDFFGPDRSCYVPVTYPGMSQMVEVIRSNGGIPVIAHIGANVKQNHTEVVADMLAHGVMGIEVFSSYHSEQMSDQLYDFALNQGALVTCGSDFHGHNKPKIEVGQCRYSLEQLTAIRRFVDRIC